MADQKSSFQYGREKLWLSALILAEGRGTIQERLESAGMHLVPLRAFESRFSEEERTELRAIISDLSRIQPEGSEGSIKATLRTMGDEEASEIAKRIFDLHTDLQGGI